MSGLAIYALLLPPCFFALYCQGAVRQNRIILPEGHGFLWNQLNGFWQGFSLLVRDHFLIHCPFSWAVAKKYRVDYIRNDVGPRGKAHAHLGFITQTDCDSSIKHEQIARLCFMSRTMFWTKSVVHLIFSPPVLVIKTMFALVEYFDPPRNSAM